MVWAHNEMGRDVCRKRGVEDGSTREWRERPRTRYMDVLKKDIEALGLGEEDVVDRVRWRRTIHGGDP